MAVDRSESNLIKAYRELTGISQKALAKEMSKDFPGVDHGLISKMENELCEPTEAMRAWVCNMANSFIESRNPLKGITGQNEDNSSETADLTPIERRVYEFLQNTDIDHRLTRFGLVKVTGLNDRQARDVIESMRAKGYRIGSELGAEGYWLIRSDEEYKRWIKVYSSRAYTVLKNKSAMDNYVKGQMRI